MAAGVRDAAGNSLDGDGDGSGGGDYTMPLLVALPGDANLDGKVDAADLNIVALHWQMSVEGWNHGDFTKDGIVNDADRTEVAVHWQQDIPRLVAAAGPVGFVRRVPRSPFQRPSYAIESNAL